MKYISVLAGAAAMFSLAAGAANAGSNVAHSPFDWSGVYFGATVGGGMLDANGPGYYYGNWYNNSDKSTGWAAGLTAGANMQAGAAVFGLEGDFGWAGFKGSGASQAGEYGWSSTWNWLATARLRAGVAVDRALIYVTGGLALADVDSQFCYYTNNCGYAGGYYDSKNSGVKAGLVAGAGVEYAMNRNISVKLEYLFVDLPTIEATTPYAQANSYGPGKFNNQASLFRAGINYRW